MTQARTNVNRLRYQESLNLKDYGATGDGVTDDSLAVLAAITDAGGMRIYVPPGTYNVETLNSTAIDAPFYIYGDGTFDGSSTGYFNIGGDIDFLRIEGLKFTNMLALAKASAGTITIDRVEIVDNVMTGCLDGVNLACEVLEATCHGNKFYNFTSTSSIHGIRLGDNDFDTTGTQTNYRIYDNWMEDFDKTSASGECHGILAYGYRMSIWGNTVKDIVNSSNAVGAEGIYVKAVDGNVYGNTLVDAGTYQGYLAIKGVSNGAERINVFGNTLYSSSGAYDGIYIETPNTNCFGNTLENFGSRAIVTGSYDLGMIRIAENHIKSHRGQYAILTQHAGVGVDICNNVVNGFTNAVSSSNPSSAIYVAVFAAGNLDNVKIHDNTIVCPSNSAGTRVSGINVRVDTGNTVKRLSIDGNSVDFTGCAVTNRNDLQLQVDGAVTRAHIMGSQGNNVTASFNWTNQANVVALALDWFVGSASTTWDPGSLADGAGETKSMTVTGASLGDQVLVSFDKDLQDMTLTGYVVSTNTVEARIQNESGAGPTDLASGTLRASVKKIY
jgi:hypothetical protein